MSPKIHPAFWSDKIIEALPPESKLTLLWLITNPQTNLLGVCEASDKRFQFETGLPPEALQRALDALKSSIYHKGGTVFLKNYLRHQFGTGPKLTTNKIFKSIASTFTGIKDKEIRSAIIAEYPEFKDVEEGHTKGFKAQREREGERTREKGGVGETEMIEEIYQLYPLKVGKPDALSKIRAALRKYDSVFLRERTQAYANAVKGTGTICPNPATWFNQERFNDAPETWTRVTASKNGQSELKIMPPGSGNY